MIRTVKDDNAIKSSSSTLPHTNGLLFEDCNLPYAKPMTEMIDGSENLNWDSTLLNFTLENAQYL
jgi:hypothetical protein